jgi:hypothetical protein
VIIVLEDVVNFTQTVSVSPKLSELLFNGRHRRITYILSQQFPSSIKPELRANFDYVFLLAEDSIFNLKRIYEHYAGVFPDFNQFRQIFKQVTENYNAMVISNRTYNDSLSNIVFHYKAPLINFNNNDNTQQDVDISSSIETQDGSMIMNIIQQCQKNQYLILKLLNKSKNDNQPSPNDKFILYDAMNTLTYIQKLLIKTYQ